jgi:hypothetical protein
MAKAKKAKIAIIEKCDRFSSAEGRLADISIMSLISYAY